MSVTIGGKGVAGWLKQGDASQELAKKQQLEADAKKAEQGHMWRFWLKQDEECQITFVDGELSSEGFLIPPRFYEHNLLLNGTWNHFFICPEKTAPDGGEDHKCPICEGGDKPYLAAAFTIIDHRTYKSKQGDKTYKDSPRLLIAKPQSFELLNKIALKRGGLAGAKFDVSRLGEKSASIGTVFDFTEKKPISELQAMFQQELLDPKTNVKVKSTVFKPADYEKEFIFRTGVELRKMGHGKGSTPHMQPSDGAPKAAEQKYEEML